MLIKFGRDGDLQRRKLLEREIIIKEDSREVVEVIAKEIDDERHRK